MNGYKTYLGAFLALAPSLASLFGFELSPLFSEQFSALLAEIITVVGAILAIYGRARAETPGWLGRSRNQP